MTESQSEAIDAERVDTEQIDPEHVDPERASSERVARPTPTPDAERWHDGLDRGPLIPDEAPNESDLPGPAHTKITTANPTP